MGTKGMGGLEGVEVGVLNAAPSASCAPVVESESWVAPCLLGCIPPFNREVRLLFSPPLPHLLPPQSQLEAPPIPFSPHLLARFGPPPPPRNQLKAPPPHAGRRAMRAFPAHLLCRNPTPPNSFIYILFKPKFFLFLIVFRNLTPSEIICQILFFPKLFNCLNSSMLAESFLLA